MTTPAKHILKGQAGEQIAADLLTAKGYTIAARNYRAGKGEIDIIPAMDKNDRVDREIVVTQPFITFPMVIVTRENVLLKRLRN